MSTVIIDAATAAEFREPQAPVEVRTEEGTLVGVFMPRREATDEDYEWAMRATTKEDVEASIRSGRGRPLEEIVADFRRR